MTRKGRRLLSPLTTLLAVWGCALALYWSDIVHYDRIHESWGIAYIVGCLALFSIGFAASTGWRRSASAVLLGHVGAHEWARDVHRLSPLISACALAGIVAAVLFTVEMIFFVGVNPLDISGRRLLYIEREVTSLSRIAFVIGAGGFFSLIAAIVCWEHLSLSRRVLWILSPVLLSLFSILSAGRQTILQLILLVVFALVVRRSRDQRARTTRKSTSRACVIGMGVLLLVAALSYSMKTGRDRNGPEDDLNKKDVILSIFDARMDPAVDAMLESLPPLARDGVTEVMIYFSHEIPSFLVFWESAFPGPYLGLWEFPFVARRLEGVSLVSSTVEERMAIAYESFAKSGRFPQVWQTWIRDLIIDFGPVGTLMVVTLLGFAAGRVYFQCRKHMYLTTTFLYVGVQLCCVYTVLIVPTSDTLAFFYMVGAFVFYMRGRKAKTGLTPGVEPSFHPPREAPLADATG